MTSNQHSITAEEMQQCTTRRINAAGTVVETIADGMVYAWNGSVWESDGIPGPVRVSYHPRNESERRYGG